MTLLVNLPIIRAILKYCPMSRTLTVILLLLSSPSLQATGLETGETTEAVSYTRQIWPIIQRQCQGCHQPAVKQGGLDLTHYEGFQKGGKSGPTFIPSDPEGSLVLAFLLGEGKPRMPLGQPALSDDQIGWFRSWISAGAKNDTPEAVGQVAATDQPPTYRLPPVITALSYSPDGGLLAVSGYREVLLHRTDASGIEARLVGISDRIQSLEFSSDGQTLMAAGGAPARFGEVQFWDVPTQTLKRSFTSCQDTIFGASLSPDASKVVFGCPDHTVRVLEAAGGSELLKMGHHEDWVLGTVFGIDGKRILSVGRDRAAKLVDASTGAFIENINLLRGKLSAVARHPSRDAVVIGGEDRVGYYYKMDRGRKMLIADDSTLIRQFEVQQGEIFALAFSPDGGKIAIAGAANEIPIYDLSSGDRFVTCKGDHSGIYAIAFHPSGRELAAGGFDGLVRIYATQSGELIREFSPVPLEKDQLTSNQESGKRFR